MTDVMQALQPDAHQASHTAILLTIAADKGGIGKTTTAFELAAALDGLAVDLDWSHGGLTRMWGFNPLGHRGARLLDALETGRAPKPVKAARRPALVPSHPDLGATSLSAATVADSLEAWAQEWGSEYRYAVVDTHPGANELTDGAMQAATLVLVPVVLATRELDALEGMLGDYTDYPLLLVPTKVPRQPPRRLYERLAAAARDAKVPVAPPISLYPGIPRRVRRAAMTLEPTPGAWVEAAAGEFRKLAATVEAICG